MIDGKRLAQLRDQLNISTEELGQAIGVSRQQIARYEANRTDITSETLIKIADFFDVTTDYLLGRSEVKEGYQRSGNYATVHLDRLIKLSPKVSARLIQALGVKIQPDPLIIDIPDLLVKLPPAYVAEFLKNLGVDFKIYNPDE